MSGIGQRRRPRRSLLNRSKFRDLFLRGRYRNQRNPDGFRPPIHIVFAPLTVLRGSPGYRALNLGARTRRAASLHLCCIRHTPDHSHRNSGWNVIVTRARSNGWVTDRLRHVTPVSSVSRATWAHLGYVTSQNAEREPLLHKARSMCR